MNTIQYLGESLWIGYLCKALIMGGFVSALLSVFSYAAASRVSSDIADQSKWKSLGRLSFIFHGASVLCLLATMFYAMVTNKYEYSYVFEHVSDELPLKYILSAFWEGQEGSFLLWMFWNIILGFILLRKNDAFNTSMMLIMGCAQVWLISMLLGIYLPFSEGAKIGSNPMTLLREMTAAPIFSNADYLSLIKGRGLNPLLQNYWMTIHPPFVFLGFALTIVPFAYAYAALVSKTDAIWQRIVLPWALFAGGILGIAILMGSLWAYEALSFGGYWAWDPVENTSLVPWIIMVAGIHTNLTSISTGHGSRATLLFYFGSFVLIIYSTLLTRSGILGDTSAHAFTEMGLEWQLTLFNLFFGVLALFIFVKKYKTIPNPAKEESSHSREFWMYLGSLVLLFSGVLINGASSLPVFNKIIRYFKSDYIGNVLRDPIHHYNKYQLWIAVFVALLSGIAVWLQYKSKKLDTPKIFVKIGIHAILAGVLTFLTTQWISLPNYQHLVMCWASWFAISSNAEYLFSIINKNPRGLSAAVSHLGFGLMGIGILSTGLNFKNLNNPFIFKGIFNEGDEQKYIQLIKGSPLVVKDYVVTYQSDTLIGKARHYDLKFKEVSKDLKVIDSFITRPNAVYSNDFSKIAAFNPDTRHYAGRDIFTCIVQLPPAVSDVEEAKKIEDTTQYQNYLLRPYDTIYLSKNEKFFITEFVYDPTIQEFSKNKHDVGFGFNYAVIDQFGKSHFGQSAIGLEGNILYKYPGVLESMGLRIRPSEKIFDNLLTNELNLIYETFKVKKDEPFKYNGYTITLEGIDLNIDTAKFEKKPGDVAVASILKIAKDNQFYKAKPIFIIRGSNTFGVKDYANKPGLHFRLNFIDPKTNTFEISIAQDQRKNDSKIPIEIATNVPRNDYIILEAKVFPGINFFWSGSLLMMIGLLLAWLLKWKKD